MYKQVPLKCKDSRKCFGKAEKLLSGRKKDYICRILLENYGSKGYEDGACPFCKPIQDVTNGKVYSKMPAQYK